MPKTSSVRGSAVTRLPYRFQAQSKSVELKDHLFADHTLLFSGYDERKMPMEPRIHISKRSDLSSGQKRGAAVGLDV
jgi:hypothetical protein